MTHDFKSSLKALQDTDFNSSNHLPHRDTWETALRIADRLQRGDVSEKAYMAYMAKHSSQIYDKKETRPKRFKDCFTECIKAMAAQLIKECEDG